MTVNDIGAAALVTLGVAFSLLAAVGILRMPDVYTRMQAATKAGTLGVAAIIAGLVVYFGELVVAIEGVLVVLFIFATAPVAAHLIARAAYTVEVHIWDQTGIDDLRGGYDDHADAPKSPPKPARPGESRDSAGEVLSEEEARALEHDDEIHGPRED